MAWVEKMNRAKEYMQQDWRGTGADEASIYSASDDDNTLPGGHGEDDPYLSDDASSIWSYPVGPDADPIQLSPPFRLPWDEDPEKPVYEGWMIHVAPEEEDVLGGTRVLGVKTVQKFNRNPGGRSNVLFTTHTQKELAAMHLEALDGYHGSHRSTGGCLPLRRLIRRHTSRRTYDDDVDERIRKLPANVQREISALVQDRGRCSSSATRKRQFTVALVCEQLYHRFASTEPTPARRHRLRWWKGNTRGRELQYFIVLVGRQTQHEAAGLPAYTRLTNPWRDVDVRQATIDRASKRAEREKAALLADPPSQNARPRPFAPTSLRRSVPCPPHERERMARVRVRSPPRERSLSRSRSRSRDPPRFWRSRSPSRDRSPSPYSYRSLSPPRSRYGLGYPYGPGLAPPPPPHPPMFTLPPYSPMHARPAPPPAPGFPVQLRYPGPPRPPVFGPGMMGPPPPPSAPWNTYPQPPYPPHPSAYFAAGSLPPSTSWPSSPHSYRNSRPVSSYGPPPPMNPFSALTTPSSLGSCQLPMFGPIPSAPVVPPPRSQSDVNSAPASRAESPINCKPGGTSRRPFVEDVDDEGDTLVGLTPVLEECTYDDKAAEPGATAARDGAKLLAKDKPGMLGDE